jgi:hypothetical protein
MYSTEPGIIFYSGYLVLTVTGNVDSGLYHEMARPDRDKFIQLITENIGPGWDTQYKVNELVGSSGTLPLPGRVGIADLRYVVRLWKQHAVLWVYVLSFVIETHCLARMKTVFL